MGSAAAIILNYNSWEDTLKEAKLVREKAGIAWKDIIVIDNCSTNDSARKLEENASGQYVFLQTGENRGYASGNNVGLRYAYEKNYKYAWIINNDILFDDERILDKLIYVFDKEDQVAVVNPDIYAPDGHMYNRDSVRPTFFDLTLGMLAYRKKGRVIEDRGGYGYVYRPQGCCMVVDLEKLREIDYLDEHTFLYSEEIILAERLAEKNYLCVCCKDVNIIHDHSKTVKSSMDKRKINKIQRNSFTYYLKQYRKFNTIQILICLVFYCLKISLLNLKT